jgi:parallel beta-helix repeat protein
MHKSWCSIFALLILLVAFPCLSLPSLAAPVWNAQALEAPVSALDLDLTVHNLDTGLSYASIQEALDAPETLSGHTILVSSGLYRENVVIAKSVSLLGEDKNSTIIDGSSLGNVVTVNAPFVTISGFTLQNASFSGSSTCGVRVSYSDINITGNIITSSQYCVYLTSSFNSVISQNSLFIGEEDVATYGINAIFSQNLTIAENTMRDDTEGGPSKGYGIHALFIRRSPGSNLTQNDVAGPHIGLGGFYIRECPDCIVSNNTMPGNGIIVYDSPSSIISENNVADSSITLYYSPNTLVSQNSVELSTGIGIQLLHSGNCTLRNNSVSMINGANPDAFRTYQFEGDNVDEYLNDVDTSNLANGKPVYHWVNRTDQVVPSDAGLVTLVNCTRITVEDLNLSYGLETILLVHTTDSVVRRNHITHSSYDISLRYSSGNYVSDNTVQLSSTYYVYVEGTFLHSSSGNIFEGNTFGIITIENSGNNTFRNNHFNDESGMTTFDLSGAALSDFFNDIDSTNTIGGRPIVYWVNATDATVPANVGYVFLVNCLRITVQNLNQPSTRISLVYTNQSEILGSVVNSIELLSSFSNTIMNNLQTESILPSGLSLSHSDDNAISQNTFRAATVDYSNNNNITNNNFIPGYYEAFYLSNSSGNLIKQNNISTVSTALYIESSSGNIITENNVTSTISYAVYCQWSSGNQFYWNNFFSDGSSPFHLSGATANSWDNGTAGNYWCDYAGTDGDNDGVGDTAYTLDASNIDHYPLMTPLSNIQTPDPPNPPTVPEFSTWAVMIFLAALTVLEVFAVKRRRRAP